MTQENTKTGPQLSDTGHPHPDAKLLLNRLEDQIIQGGGTAGVIEILKREALWKRLDQEAQLRWAELAQMAGDPETALSILTHLNQSSPGNESAWQRHLELLLILEHKEDFARVLASASLVLGEEDTKKWSLPVTRGGADPEVDIESAIEPFDKQHRRLETLNRFISLFSGREDCFARQWTDKKADKQGYVPVRKVFGPAELEEHLGGRKTYGIYLMQSDGRIKTAVIDADLQKKYRGIKISPDVRNRIRREAGYLISRIKEISNTAGGHPLVEVSGGKGYHMWYFFDPPASAGPVRGALQRLVQMLAPDLSTFHLEVFPKQGRLSGKGLGNLVKLPLGIHRLTGNRSFFLECADRSLGAQLTHLSTVRLSDSKKMVAHWQAPGKGEMVMHPRLKAWAASYPDLYRLQTCCPPLAQIITFCVEGGNVSMREEKILYQTIGFLSEGKRMVNYLFSQNSEYNPHMVDYRLSRLRGTPLGCKRIHSLTGFTGDYCRFRKKGVYLHPLLHMDNWLDVEVPRAEKAENLSSALERLQSAICEVERFIK